MVNEHETTPSSPAPPAPHTPPAELAPPLVSPSTAAPYSATPPYSAAPAYPAYPATLPPYATAAPNGAAPQHPIPPYYQPHQPPPPSSASGGKIALIVIGSIAAFMLIVVLVLVSVFTWLVQSAESEAGPVPQGGGTVVEEPEEPAEPADPDTPSGGWSDSTDTTAGDSIGIELEAKIAEYKLARDNGSLWDTIPDTEYNRTAVSAFLYLLTDMKSATIWGVDENRAQEYADRMVHLEELLLSGQPLGSDIKIVLSDRTFRYDGDTGEGGYSDE